MHIFNDFRTNLQPFYRGLPRDPGNWKKQDLRIQEVTAWRDAGFPKGSGCPVPDRDRSPYPEWPTELVLVGSAFGDPFVIDLSKLDQIDAPILTAEHGVGRWEFVRYAASFESFIKGIKVKE